MRIHLLLAASIAMLAACTPQVATVLPPTIPPTAVVTVPPTLPPTLPPTTVVNEPPTIPPTLPPTLVVTLPSTVLPPTLPQTVPPTPQTPYSPAPGIVLYGYVRRADGSGVPNVSICRSYASYNGVIVATTDANGYFQSDFAAIPGDEMVGLWPVAQGYTFDPPTDRWRHYYGPEASYHEFIASPASATAVPPVRCP